VSRITPDTSPKVECQISQERPIYMTARPNGVVLKQRASSEFSPQSKESLIHLTLDEARELAWT
jgi:hypothetical protein